MANTTKKALLIKLNALHFVLNDSHGAVGVDEKTRAANGISVRALDMMEALETNLTPAAAKMALSCERTIDKATRYVEHLKAFT